MVWENEEKIANNHFEKLKALKKECCRAVDVKECQGWVRPACSPYFNNEHDSGTDRPRDNSKRGDF